MGSEMCIRDRFPRRNKYGIDKLMRLKIPGLCLVEDFADIVDWPLDGPGTDHRVRALTTGSGSPLSTTSGPRAPSGSGFPLGRGSSGPPCAGSGPSDRGVVAGPLCPWPGSPSLAGGTLVSPWRACSVLSATSTMLTASADAARYKNKVSPGSGATNTGSEVRCCFSSWKACSASSVQENGPDLLKSLKKVRALSARVVVLDANHGRVAEGTRPSPEGVYSGVS